LPLAWEGEERERDLLSGIRGLKELLIDGERTLLDGGSEVAARLRGIVGVEGGESRERREKLRRIDPRFENFLQLP